MRILIALLLIFLSAPVFAGNYANITMASDAPIYVNTKTPTSILNITFNVTPGGSAVNVTGINLTFFTSAGAPLNLSNFTSVEIRNETNVFGSNSSINVSSNNITITFSTTHLFVNGTSRNMTVGVFINLSLSSTLRLNFTVNITSNNSIYTTDSSDNYTIFGGSLQSRGSNVQDTHANVSVWPRIFDTNVTNQTIVYNFTITGRDKINTTSIIFPSGYFIVNITNVTVDGSLLTQATTCPTTETAKYCSDIGKNRVNLTYGGITSGSVIAVTLTVNTSTTAVGVQTVNSTLTSHNLTEVYTDIINTSAKITNILSVISTNVVKGAAVVNDSDYWEFNFTVNVTESVTGMLQFRMANWSGNGGLSIALTNQTDPGGARFYASVRNQSSLSGAGLLNVSNEYNITKGISYTSLSSGTLVSIILRMVIPTGTSVSNTWQTTYAMLFRTS